MGPCESSVLRGVRRYGWELLPVQNIDQGLGYFCFVAVAPVQGAGGAAVAKVATPEPEPGPGPGPGPEPEPETPEVPAV